MKDLEHHVTDLAKVAAAIVFFGMVRVVYVLVRKLHVRFQSGLVGRFERELIELYGAKSAERLIAKELSQQPKLSSREGAAMSVLARRRFESEGGGRPL